MKLQAPLCMAVAWVFLGTMQFSQSETLIRSLGLENAFVAEDEDNVMERGGVAVKPLPQIPDDWEYDWSHLLDWTQFHKPPHRNPWARKGRSDFDLPEGRQGATEEEEFYLMPSGRNQKTNINQPLIKFRKTYSWCGPYAGHFSNSQCPVMGHLPKTATITQCELACGKLWHCDAFNWSVLEDQECVLRSCRSKNGVQKPPGPQPAPIGRSKDWISFSHYPIKGKKCYDPCPKTRFHSFDGCPLG